MTSRYAAWRRRVQCAIGLLVLAGAMSIPALAQSSAAARALPADQRTVLVLGDSLSAAYGLRASEGWVALLGQRLSREHPEWRVVNASVSGETTAGGASRIVGELRRHRPDVVVIELGANDGLRGLPTLQTRINLARMIGAAHGADAEVLLVGMRMPPNYGRAYTEKFFDMFKKVSAETRSPLVPFMLEGVADKPAMFQQDRLHPLADAHPIILSNIWPQFASLIKKQ